MPSNSSTGRILQAATQLTHALSNSYPPTPFEHVGDAETITLTKITRIFNKKAQSNITTENETVQRVPKRTTKKKIQPSVKPIQRAVLPLHRVTGRRNSRPVNNETYRNGVH